MTMKWSRLFLGHSYFVILLNEIIKKNEKETHDAREEAKRAEEAAERARHIGIIFEF
jgi:precorrin-3B methylase